MSYIYFYRHISLQLELTAVFLISQNQNDVKTEQYMIVKLEARKIKFSYISICTDMHVHV